MFKWFKKLLSGSSIKQTAVASGGSTIIQTASLEKGVMSADSWHSQTGYKQHHPDPYVDEELRRQKEARREKRLSSAKRKVNSFELRDDDVGTRMRAEEIRRDVDNTIMQTIIINEILSQPAQEVTAPDVKPHEPYCHGSYDTSPSSDSSSYDSGSSSSSDSGSSSSGGCD